MSTKKRITEGPQFSGWKWVAIVVISWLILSGVFGVWIAKYTAATSLLPGIPAVVFGVLVYLFFKYNYHRNN